jgi:hypothetical protein
MVETNVNVSVQDRHVFSTTAVRVKVEESRIGHSEGLGTGELGKTMHQATEDSGQDL